MRTASRFRFFSDVQWELISGLLPSNEGRRGHPFGDDRRVVEGIVYRYRTGIPWRDLPRSEFGPWQTVWKRHRRYAADGTWDRVLRALLTLADAQGHWELACMLEELPSAKTPMVHENIIKDLVTLGKLIDSQTESSKSKTAGLDDE